jgi:ribonuclease J
VIFASSLIPGKEKDVNKLVNRILTLGADVISSRTAKVHCSGHANQGELRIAYNVVQPKNVMPIHGEVQHLLANAAVAQSCGIAQENIAVVRDGTVVDVCEGQAKVVGRLENGYIFVDGKSVGEVSDLDLTQRKILGKEGFIAISVAVDLTTREVVSLPKISAIAVAEDLSVFAKLPKKITKRLRESMEEDRDISVNKLAKIVRRTVGNYVGNVLKRAPMILPLVSTVNRTIEADEADSEVDDSQ